MNNQWKSSEISKNEESIIFEEEGQTEEEYGDIQNEEIEMGDNFDGNIIEKKIIIKSGGKWGVKQLDTHYVKIGSSGIDELKKVNRRKYSMICIPVPDKNKYLNVNAIRTDQIIIPNYLQKLSTFTYYNRRSCNSILCFIWKI